MRRVAILMNGLETDRIWGSYLAAFRESLTILGWAEGQNLRIDVRWNNGPDERVSLANAAELIGFDPDVILASTSPNLKAAQASTHSIPIVFVSVSDPVTQGFVSNLARPGGNTSGFTAYEFSIGGKWLELLKTIVPDLARVAVVFGAEPQSQFFLTSVTTAAPGFGIEVVAFPVRDIDEIESAMVAMSRGPASGLIFPTGYLLTRYDASIAGLALRHRLPAIYAESNVPENGGLISYAYDAGEEFRQAASYVNRILKGEKPADLPIQQPTKFTLVINQKTAKAQGLMVPQSLLIFADRVIE